MAKKRNKKAIIITAVVMFIGVLLVLLGIFGGRIFASSSTDFDYKNIKPGDLGKTVKTDILVYYDSLELDNKDLQFFGENMEDEDYVFLLLDFSNLSAKEKKIYYAKFYQHITITGKLRAVDDAEYSEVCEALYKRYDYIYEEKKDPVITIDQFHELLTYNVLPYCIEVTSVKAFNWTPFIFIGAALFLIAFIVEICFVFKLKKRIVLPIVFALMIIIPAIMLFNHIRTMLSVKKVTDGFYTMKNLECTDTQGMLENGAGTVNEFIDWMLDNHVYGMPNFIFNEDDYSIGCASFAATTSDGDHLFGRNFDYPETDMVLVHSHPKDAYESIGCADLAVFSVGQTSTLDPDSPLGRFVMVLTPYFIVDGMNEKGVGAGILELDIDEAHQDRGKPDLLIFCCVRAVLDNCASVDEALALLESYDIQSDLGYNYHLFITDKTGRYVVVEWLGSEMVVTEYPACTNSVIAPGDYFDMGDPDNRIDTICTGLGTERVVAESEAMMILDEVSCSLTEWSCVYNLDDFTVSICLDTDYEKVYTFRAEELR
ncbi:MAG: linear amide C-N hydrolase [Clostridiales bacterium]|nr:linear amide C-N hydrolase [Clostridiales bacterium]